MWNMPVNVNESSKKKLILCLKHNFVRFKDRQVIWLRKCRCETNHSSENELYITSVNATFGVGALDIWFRNQFTKSETNQRSGFLIFLTSPTPLRLVIIHELQKGTTSIHVRIYEMNLTDDNFMPRPFEDKGQVQVAKCSRHMSKRTLANEAMGARSWCGYLVSLP